MSIFEIILIILVVANMSLNIILHIQNRNYERRITIQEGILSVYKDYARYMDDSKKFECQCAIADICIAHLKDET